MEKKPNLHANHRQRLKNRALRETLDGFEPHNVLELMLFYVLPHVDTNEIAHELINRFGSFDAVFSAPIEELVKVKGIKQHAATFIKLIPEFSRYYAKGHNENVNPKMSVQDIKDKFTSYFVGRKEETIICIFLDSDDYFIDIKPMFFGSMQDVAFSYRALVNEALCVNAYKVAVAHNHPSGSPVPSFEDHSTFFALKRSLAQMNIELIDSFIVSHNSCVGTNEYMKRLDSADKEALLKALRNKTSW